MDFFAAAEEAEDEVNEEEAARFLGAGAAAVASTAESLLTCALSCTLLLLLPVSLRSPRARCILSLLVTLDGVWVGWRVGWVDGWRVGWIVGRTVGWPVGPVGSTCVDDGDLEGAAGADLTETSWVAR